MPRFEYVYPLRRTMYRSRNPTLSDSTFDKSNYKEAPWWDESSNLMTMEGTAEKTGILLIITTTLAIATYSFRPELAIIGFLGGFITAMIVICLLYTSPSPRDLSTSRMPSSA